MSTLISLLIILIGFTIFAVDYFIIRNPRTREQAGLHLDDDKPAPQPAEKAAAAPPEENGGKSE